MLTFFSRMDLGQRAMPLIIDPGLYQTIKSNIFWVTPRRAFPTTFKLFTGDNNNKDDRAGGYMLMDSSGFSGITSWVELWGKISSTFLSLVYVLIFNMNGLFLMLPCCKNTMTC